MFKVLPKVKDGLLSFDINDKTTKKVTEFYTVEPFPNYEVNENKGTLLFKGNRNKLSEALKGFIGLNKSFIEIGSGTSQLSNYLAAGTNNKIFAFDPTEAALMRIFLMTYFKTRYLTLFGVLVFCITLKIPMRDLRLYKDL